MVGRWTLKMKVMLYDVWRFEVQTIPGIVAINTQTMRLRR